MLRNRPLVALALGIALGGALIQVATGVDALVDGLLYEVEDENGSSRSSFSLEEDRRDRGS